MPIDAPPTGIDAPRLATDARALDDLRRAARSGSGGAAKAAARQFEQVFVQMLMKSMRDASPGSDPLSGSATRMYQGMLDAQWAQALAQRGVGLAPIIEKQLAAGQPRAEGAPGPSSSAVLRRYSR